MLKSDMDPQPSADASKGLTQGPRVRFGEFVLDLERRALYRGQGEEIPLASKPFETLVVLVKNHGRTVSIKDLLQQVWSDVEVSHGTVHQAVRQIRLALGDDPENPQFIQTLRRGKGYRFVAAVQSLAGTHSTTLPVGADDPHAESQVSLAGREPWRAVAGLRRPLLALPALVVLTAVAIALVLVIARLPGSPVRATVAGSTLYAWDAKGRMAWEYPFPETLLDRNGVPPLSPQDWRLQAVDLDGDGEKEILLAAVFLQPQAVDGREREELFCLSPRGKLLWHYRPELTVRQGDESFKGPWLFSGMAVTPANPGEAIWLSAVHLLLRPSFVLKINPHGTAKLQFLSAGNIYSLYPVRRNGAGYILAGGINNEYASASLAVLREDGAAACSPQTPGTRFECVDGPKGSPERYFLFPPSEMTLFETAYNRVHKIYRLDQGLVVETYELNLVGAFYRFSEALEPESVTFSDGFALLHRRFEQEGRLKHKLDDCPQLNKPIQVRRWDPVSGWTTMEVPQAKGVRPDVWRP